MEITTHDWTVCHKLCAFLEVPSKINEELCGQDYPTIRISLVIPASEAMLIHCTRYANDQDETLKNAAATIRAYHDKYSAEINSVPDILGKLLDPRHRLPAEMSEDWTHTREILNHHLDQMQPKPDGD